MTDLDQQATTAANESIASDSQTEPAVEHLDKPRSWSVWMAFLMSWWRPATTAGRLQHVSLPKAFGIHVTATLLTTFLVLALVAAYRVNNTIDFTAVFDRFLYMVLRDVIGELARHPYLIGLSTLGIVLAIEVGFFLLALLILPWGAADEPFRNSLRNALRWTWLHTTHALPVALFIGLSVVGLSQMDRSFSTRYYDSGTRPQWPSFPTQAKRGSPEWNEYQKARRAYMQESLEWSENWESQKPWVLRHMEMSIGLTCMMSTLWVLWTLLRGAGTKRHVAYRPRPPTCESCGYNLTKMPMEGRCPECGEAVELSLGPNVRSGAPWSGRKDIGVLKAWWQTTALLFLQPKTFGRAIALRPADTDHRKFFAWHLPVFFLLGGSAVVAAYTVDQGHLPFGYEPFVAYFITSIMGVMATLVAIAVCLLVAMLVASWFQWSDKRNLSSGAIQVTCYLASVFAIWIALAALLFGVVIWMEKENLFHLLQNLSNIDDDVLLFLAWLIPNLIAAIFYISIAARATAGTRHANR